jgi:hypothetical protein
MAPAAKADFQKPESAHFHFRNVRLGTEQEDALPDDKFRDSDKCGETWTLIEMQRKLEHSRIDLLKLKLKVSNGRSSNPGLGSDTLVLPT